MKRKEKIFSDLEDQDLLMLPVNIILLCVVQLLVNTSQIKSQVEACAVDKWKGLEKFSSSCILS